MIGRHRAKTGRLGSLRQRQRLPGETAGDESAADAIPDMTAPPEPPIVLTPAVACSSDTDPDVLWHIARNVPELRRWLVANPQADAGLLEYVSQAGGPGVRRALEILLESMEEE
ncbi:hypothetical protein [Bifidobacterium callitrichidarum]|uniref:Leucine rich repeat variant domain-containing protein n=1 Tax=Bifidobacterium callitrichidarum TaxID=2052941 RepID=A0A2U2N9T0_9BIFI|nr:hypothetical protein [Bifidobacterium callitrichidarum]PWG65931.1 hypothetical protein DF196_06205 [Bifidobacterium callitrichidarum]